MVKKKRSNVQSNEGNKQDNEDSSNINEEKNTSVNAESEQVSEKIPIFKDQKYFLSGKGATAGKRTRIWKSLKQIITADRLLPVPARDISYSSIDSPPSTKPSKKYSDLSGLPANYTDPVTKLRYSNSEEYAKIKTLSPDIVNDYLSLRKANNPIT
ncbi:INO80 complex subunit C [Centruroides vittatus]|uniref:INO80 complex subunit C n=1 Tax=Centruroides vittatus TaxID=120091 RepID=UPI00350EAF69